MARRSIEVLPDGSRRDAKSRPATRRAELDAILDELPVHDRTSIVEQAHHAVYCLRNSRGLGTTSEGLSERLHRIRIVRPTDFDEYGGNVARESGSELHADCSCGCRHAAELRGKFGADWLVCLNPNGPRFGLLTFEHQAGFGCFEAKGRKRG